MYARPFIDSLDFARNGQKISGEVSVAELSRLHDMLEVPQGTLSYTLQGGMDSPGNIFRGDLFLVVRVTGLCRLRCQRCLEGMDHQVLLDTRLFLRDQKSLDALSEEEEFDSILADAHLDVMSLLEDEILLSLPIAPKHDAGGHDAAGHEPGACRATEEKQAHPEDQNQEEQNPFAVLAKLANLKRNLQE